MSDPVTHEIDLDEAERAWEEYGGRSDAMVAHYVPGLIARLRAAEARAEAAEAERDLLAAQAPSLISERAHYKAEADALRARVPTEDEIVAIRFAVTSAPRSGARLLRALVARNTPKEKTDGE